MSLLEIVELVRTFDRSLVLAPEAGSAFPEIAWGDYFFYYARDGEVPANEQPYATIVTKDYPDDCSSHLDLPDRWRLNIHVGRQTLERLTVQPVGRPAGDPAADDVVLPHPVYGALGWISVINPGEQTAALVSDLLRQAHDQARLRDDRRRDHRPDQATD